MSTTEGTATVVPIKKNLAEEITNQLTAIAAKATDDERKRVEALVTEARGSKWRTAMVKLTATMAALLFLHHNSHNRPWNPGATMEWLRRMKLGRWRKSHGIGFYIDGLLWDGQHRLAAQALAGIDIEWPVLFGLDRSDIDGCDDGRNRSGADHAGLDGIVEAKVKQAIVANAAAFFLKTGDKSAALKSKGEIKDAIEQNDRMLDDAIAIGKTSGEGLAIRQLKESTAASIAYVMLRSAWPVDVVRHRLREFQTSGTSASGSDDPLFVTIQFLEGRRKRAGGREKLNTSREMAAVICALLETEKGTRAIQPKFIKAAVDGKTFPDPHYPTPAAKAAA
jgi:hypothetical protein